MDIKPTMCRELVLLHQDGSFEMAPFQVIEADGGRTIIRIGRNVFYFAPDGGFVGSECKGGSDSDAAALMRAFDEQIANHGLAPQEAYFEPGSRGHRYETAGWSQSKLN